MATDKQIALTLKSISAIYPYYANKAEDTEVLAKLWYKLLEPYTDEQVSKAIYLCLQKCKTPPTPADIIEQIEYITELNTNTKSELWDTLNIALNKAYSLSELFKYTRILPNGKTQGEQARIDSNDIYNNLSEELKQYLGGYGEFMRMSAYDDESLKFEKNRFMKEIKQIKKDCKVKSLVGSEIKKLEG